MNYAQTRTNGSARDEALKRHSATVPPGAPLRACQDVVDKFPNEHLIVATVRSATALQPGKQLLARLLEALKPRGHYALGELQEGNHFAVRCVFEREEDAVTLGMATRATLGGRHPGFATQRTFLLNHGAYKGIKTVLAKLDGSISSSAAIGSRLPK